MQKIKVVFVDDHPSVLSGLELMLSSVEHLQIVGGYRSGNALLEAINIHLPDVVLMDIQMPGANGFDLCRQVTTNYPSVKVIALTGCDEKFQLKAMFQNGACGYLLKTAEKETIVEAIDKVMLGQHYIHDELKHWLVEQMVNGRTPGAKGPTLTKREKEILSQVAGGASNQEIASRLFLSVRTVENHRFNIMQKLDVKNAAGLVREALERGIA